MSDMMLGSLHAQVKKIDTVPDTRDKILGSRSVGESREAEVRKVIWEWGADNLCSSK